MRINLFHEDLVRNREMIASDLRKMHQPTIDDQSAPVLLAAAGYIDVFEVWWPTTDGGWVHCDNNGALFTTENLPTAAEYTK